MPRASFWILLTTGLLLAGLWLVPRWLGPPMLGQALGWLLVLYHVVLLGGAWLRSHHTLIDAWLFLAPLSVFLLLPAWVLARELGVLAFPQLGGERVGPVPAYVVGLWFAPLLIVLWLSELAHRRSAALALLVAALAGGAVLGAAEWAAHGQALWHARGVARFQGVALHVLAAGPVLGVATWWMFAQVESRALPLKVAGAAAVSVFYTGVAVALLLAFRHAGIA